MGAHRIAVIGAGYVGLTTAACLSRLGHRVHCADLDQSTVDDLRHGVVGLREPGLAELVAAGLAEGTLDFGADNLAAVQDAEFVFLCLPTPSAADGAADLGAVHAVLSQIGPALREGCVVVVKSTVPLGSTRDLRARLDRAGVAVASNPEFLREGHAVTDFLHPQRVVVGASEEDTARRVLDLYRDTGAPTLITDPASAELVKYASNSFLAMKLSYVNTLAELCERTGADLTAVTEGLGQDERIGPAFLAAGPGWGGSCLPKDTRALLHTATEAEVEFPLLAAAIQTNERQAGRITGLVAQVLARPLRGARIGLLGLTFKAGTDDLRDSPALAVAQALATAGAHLRGFDPGVPAGQERIGPVGLVSLAELVAEDADAVVLLTEWPEFTELDWPGLAARMRTPLLVDTRDHLPAKALAAAGIRHHRLGHPTPS
ncbi:UDP-glucose dehydrogenase family protein [Crossiella sp. CA198]|uniref:UDP-glucose dehydrogenase family protein n=1 Tax=Crossiella sp. CA198 TaxID=3455607 RepID=UPI003F8D8A23